MKATEKRLIEILEEVEGQYNNEFPSIEQMAEGMIARGVTFAKDMNVSGNPYWKNICDIAERQRAKGIATYGKGIEMNPADIVTRIAYLQEELVDALMYCEWIKSHIVGADGERKTDG